MSRLRGLLALGALLLGLVAMSLSDPVEGYGVRLIAPLIKHPLALLEREIDDLARLAGQVNGTKKVGQALGARNLPEPVLSDTYLRIAIHRGKLDRLEAQQMMVRLEEVPGFRSTLSKIIGNSDAKSAGHLNELRIALHSSDRQFRVMGIGVPFDDGIKKATTDIDVLLSRGGRQVAIEAKDYGSETPIPLDAFRADMETLVAYVKKTPNAVPIFSMTAEPVDKNVLRLVAAAAEQRGVNLVVGDPLSVSIQIDHLLRLL